MLCRILGHNWGRWTREIDGVIYFVRVRVCCRCGKFHNEGETPKQARYFNARA